MNKIPSKSASQSVGIQNCLHTIVDSAGLSPDDLSLILLGTTLKNKKTTTDNAGNILSQQRFELYAKFYVENPFYPSNLPIDEYAEPIHFFETKKTVFEQHENTGIIWFTPLKVLKIEFYNI